VWFLTHGSWPKVIHHRCGNRHCCNPDHLVEMPSLGAHSRLHAGETCPRGHKPERFRIREDNSRYCRECDRLRKRAARHGPDGSRLRAKEAAAQKRRRSDG